MTVRDLKRYEELLSSADLVNELRHPGQVPTVPLGAQADLDTLKKTIDKELKNYKKETQLDVKLVSHVHRTFAHLSHQDTNDMRFWQWIAVVQYKKFVARRWFGEALPGTREELDELVGKKPSNRIRFIGANSMNGRSRQAFARLFVAGQTLYQQRRGYDLAEAVFETADRQMAIFDRKFSLLSAAAEAVTELSRGKSGKEAQRLGLRLNRLGVMMSLEHLSVSEITALLK